jgi:hypothetical protein
MVAPGRRSWQPQRPLVPTRQNYNNRRNDPEYQKIIEEVRDHIEQYRKAVAAD